MEPLNLCENLVDAKQMSIDNPATFEYPESEIDSLLPGDYAKISHNRERFWVELNNVDGDNLAGLVNNDLVHEQPFKCDDPVSFEKRHVFQVIKS